MGIIKVLHRDQGVAEYDQHEGEKALCYSHLIPKKKGEPSDQLHNSLTAKANVLKLVCQSRGVKATHTQLVLLLLHFV